MSVERSVMEKLASSAFTDEERGYLVEMLLAKKAGDAEDCAGEPAPAAGKKAPPFAKKDEEEEKKSSAAPALDYDAIVKEASALSDEELKQAIDAAAAGIPEAEQDAIVKQAFEDTMGEINFRKQAMEQGYWLFQGFELAAQEKLAHQREKQAAAGFVQKAPAIARALAGR